jgi:hypothetical protein
MVRARPCHNLRNFCDSVHGLQNLLWDNPEFIQDKFHVGRFVMAVVDTKADQENIEALYSGLKTTSA